jgi:peptide deformylase
VAVLRVHKVPDDEAFLRQIAAPVTAFDEGLKRIAADMLETLPSLGGIGLAAPQVGHSLRMVLIDVSHSGDEAHPAPPPFFLVNPRIISGVGKASLKEGCLSVPGQRVEIPRLSEIDVEAWTLEGRRIRFFATELMAIVIQHETDHLNGKLIVDWAAAGCPVFREEDLPKDAAVLD